MKGIFIAVKTKKVNAFPLEPERITLVANTSGGLFGSGFGSLFNLGALDTLGRLGNQIEH